MYNGDEDGGEAECGHSIVETTEVLEGHGIALAWVLKTYIVLIWGSAIYFPSFQILCSLFYP